MKRFLVDGVLIIILVAIGNTFVDQDIDPLHLDEKIARFEKQIEQQEIIQPQIKAQSIKPIELNQASLAAKASGEVIETIVETGVGIVASVFKAIVE